MKTKLDSDLNLDALRDAIRKLADEHPDAVYEKAPDYHVCLYHHGHGLTPDGTQIGTGCLIGQALRKLGYRITTRDSIAALLNLAIPGEEFEDIQACQACQDNGNTWRQAARYLRPAREVA